MLGEVFFGKKKFLPLLAAAEFDSEIENSKILGTALPVHMFVQTAIMSIFSDTFLL